MAKRDTTKALGLIIGARNTNDAAERNGFLDEAIQILRDTDARTGRRDPSKRKRPASAKKAAR